MFVDIVKIKVRAGKGGDGKVSFHREKYVAAGGPDGGDGGKGGDVVFVVDDHMATLLDFRFKRKYLAENGQDGGGKKCFGKGGADLVIRVPRGTLIKDQQSGLILKDMSDEQPFVAARGGRGGWGNARFATPVRQAPRFAKPGLEGEERELTLELKLIADVGLIGFPNVGKSTLLSAISKARPKIANYHFTTLSPNLGVVYVDEGQSFVAADIPGLIEGASSGAGLGHHFLRHIDRCRLLVHLVDASGSEGRDPLSDFELINAELKQFSEALAARPQIVVANKCDLIDENNENLQNLRKLASSKGFPLYEISAVAGANVQRLIYAIWQQLEKLPPVQVYEPELVVEEYPEMPEREIILSREEQDGEVVFHLSGAWIERIVRSVNFDDYESRMYFERVLRKAGVYDMLEKEGVEEGQTVELCGLSFSYVY